MPHHDHPEGLAHDLTTLQKRRRALLWLAGATGVACAPLLACGGGKATNATSGSTGISTVASAGNTSSDSSTCAVIPEETAGPFPGDGSNNTDSGVANALMLAGIDRSDIRSSFAGATGVATGMALTVTLSLVNTLSNCSDLAGYAIYLWHCDAAGRYSMYSDGVTAENYLRGVQAADADGWVEFTTIFPGCYAGRWPHVHFEVYESLDAATSVTNKLRTSQLAFPEDVCREVYATDGYESSVSNLSGVSLDSDGIFSDGYSLQMATMKGSAAGGLTATLNVPI